MNKKRIIIISIIILFVLGLMFLFFFAPKKPEIPEPVTYNFSLIGGNMIEISQFESYNDMFVIATDSKGNDLSKNVSVNNTVDSTKAGKYTVTYTLKVNDYEQTLTRYVIVVEKAKEEYSLVLNGEETVYLLKGSEYKDAGCSVYRNGAIYSDDVLIINDIDAKVPGNYKVSCSYNIDGEMKSIYRNVIVYEVNYNFSKSTNNGIVEINFSTDSEYYDHIVLKDGTSSNEKKYNYKITKNGLYSFSIYDKFGHYVTEEVNIDIIYNNISCSGTVNRNGTTITVTGADRNYASKYYWTIDGKNIQDDYSYTASYKKVKSASVEVTFNSGTTKKISCSIASKLIYEFKYDEFNTKPFMKCKTYTADDKTRLNAILKNAVDDAGYGTRAGAVEAARFLVGGLDYKVPYLGPKKIDSSLGRYNKTGLNIGTNYSWGCMVSGWTQGMDCTNFVSWVFYQAGIDGPSSYSSSYNYKIAENLDKVKVGDLVLTPKESSFGHVGIIIGIDNKYIYVAESTTGSINAIIVSKLDKSNLPKSGKFSIFKSYPYAKEGNVTNMWVS